MWPNYLMFPRLFDLAMNVNMRYSDWAIYGKFQSLRSGELEEYAREGNKELCRAERMLRYIYTNV